MKKVLVGSFLFIGLVGLLFLPSAAFADKDTLVVALEADVTTLDPHKHVNTPEFNILSHIYDHLTDIDDDANIAPWLAKSWKVEPDQVTWTFFLHPGVKFHNGDDLTADDVKFSIERVLDPATKSPQAYRIRPIKEVKVIDPQTVQIITEAPFPTLLGELRSIEIMSRRICEEMGSKVASNPIGSGPFKFVRWIRDDQIELEAVADHPLVKPKVRRVIFRIIPEVSTRVTELKAGTVDIIKNVPPSEIKALEQDPNFKISRTRSLRVMYVGFRHDRKPFDDKRVRQAVAYAIDKEAIVKYLLEGFASVAANPAAPACFGDNPNIHPYPYDPETAKKLLQQAGLSDGFETFFDSPSGKYLADKEIAGAIANNLSKIGINATLRASEYGTFLKYVNTEPSIFLFAWGAGVPDVDAVFYRNFHSSSKNRIHYINPEADRLMDIGRSTVDPEERKKAYFKLQEIFYDELPWVPLVVLDDVLAMQKNVMGFQSRADERIRLYDTYKE